MGREGLRVELELPLSCQLEVLAAVSFICTTFVSSCIICARNCWIPTYLLDSYL